MSDKSKIEAPHGLFQPIEGHIDDEDQMKGTIVSEEGVEWEIETSPSQEEKSASPDEVETIRSENVEKAAGSLHGIPEGNGQEQQTSEHTINQEEGSQGAGKEMPDSQHTKDHSDDDREVHELKDGQHDTGREDSMIHPQKSESPLIDHKSSPEAENLELKSIHKPNNEHRPSEDPNENSNKGHMTPEKSEEEASNSKAKTSVPSEDGVKRHGSPKSKDTHGSMHSGSSHDNDRSRHLHRRHRSAENHHESERRKPSYVRVNPHKHHSSFHDKQPDDKLEDFSTTSGEHSGHRPSEHGPPEHGQHKIRDTKTLPLATRLAMAVRSSVQGLSVHETRPLSSPPLDRKPSPLHDSHHGFNEHTLSAFIHSAAHSHHHHHGHHHGRHHSGSQKEQIDKGTHESQLNDAGKVPILEGKEVRPEDSVSRVH
ncbi:hypothetical protein MMC10_009600 [Thelotrema lepadinum]|nr:hypothetical protein [Thelotrema lepadinum]